MCILTEVGVEQDKEKIKIGYIGEKDVISQCRSGLEGRCITDLSAKNGFNKAN